MAETYVTRAGFEKLRAEMEPLLEQKRQLSKDIAEAREKGDLKENAEYHSAKEKLGLVMTRIAQLEEKLRTAKIIDETKGPKDAVAIGCRVTLKDEDGDESSYILVGAEEADPAESKISVFSPLAQGLLGKKTGEKATVQLPAGTRSFRVSKIEPA